MLQSGSEHVGIEDVHIFKHCHEMTGLLSWIGTYCISCVVQQTSRIRDLSSLVRYDDSCLAAIRGVQSIIRIVRPRPNILSHSLLLLIAGFFFKNWNFCFWNSLCSRPGDSSMHVRAFFMLLLWIKKEYGLLKSNLWRLGLRGFSNNGLDFSFNCLFTSNIIFPLIKQ